ncbi:MAG: hypothetical protein HQK53_20015, partial [Oligoflexia bacterium]|nr:hypothetical protein [Oligoflexia bacterium]
TEISSNARIWSVASGANLQRLEGHSESVRCAAFSFNSELVATGSDDKSIKIWDTATGARLATFVGHRGAVLSVAFNSERDQIVSASEDGTVKIWKIDWSR